MDEFLERQTGIAEQFAEAVSAGNLEAAEGWLRLAFRGEEERRANDPWTQLIDGSFGEGGEGD